MDSQMKQESQVMDLILEHKDVGDWIYRNEGAANLVLAYTGSFPAFVGKVMRIPKAPKNGNGNDKGGSPTLHARVNCNGSVLTTHEKLVWREHADLLSSPNTEILGQLYAQHVIGPLLGPKYVDAGVRVLVSREFLESVEKNVMSQRPTWRVDAAEVDAHLDSVILLSDHSLFGPSVLKGESCISVEIKPKCGFLPLSKYIAETNASKRSTSRFRMHQMLKLHLHEISELSEYNPLDLFSGSRDRICKAINALYATPQNNFRVFLNGSLIFGGVGGGTKSTSSVTGKAFEDALKSVIQAGDGERIKSFIQLISETIYNSGILGCLLEAQKLDDFDIEGAIHGYYNVISEPCMACGEIDENKMPQRYTSLHSIPLNESLKIVKNFLIAATAKDCSLMISFRPRKDGESASSYNSMYLESTNQNFDYKMHFIDLDLKPLKKMEYYYKLDKKIVSYYNEDIKRAHEAKGSVSK